MSQEHLQAELAQRLRKWVSYWQLERHQVVCLGCKRRQNLALAQMAEPFFHGSDCSQGQRTAPWTDLQMALGVLARCKWADIEASAVTAAAHSSKGGVQ